MKSINSFTVKISRYGHMPLPNYRSDFMDKYLDVHNSDAMDIHYLTTTVAAQAEMKKKENT
jgi:dihydroxyacetone kinase